MKASRRFITIFMAIQAFYWIPLLLVVALQEPISNVGRAPSGVVGFLLYSMNMIFIRSGWAISSLTLLILYFFEFKFDYKKMCKEGRTEGLIFIGSNVYWVLGAHGFRYVAQLIGQCVHDGINESLRTYTACARKRGTWIGFDISGHCFLVLHSSLLLIRAIMQMQENRKTMTIPESQNNYILIFQNCLIAPSTIILVTWYMVYIQTVLYYHTFFEKALGITFGAMYANAVVLFQYNFKSRLPVYRDN